MAHPEDDKVVPEPEEEEEGEEGGEEEVGHRGKAEAEALVGEAHRPVYTCVHWKLCEKGLNTNKNCIFLVKRIVKKIHRICRMRDKAIGVR